MRVKPFLVATFAMFVLSTLNPEQLLAADAPGPQTKASTSELPAALTALGADDSRILSQREAEDVRGSLFIGFLDITFISPAFATSITFSDSQFDLIVITIVPDSGLQLIFQ